VKLSDAVAPAAGSAWRRTALLAVAELLLWLTAPALFLWAYVVAFATPSAACVPHLQRVITMVAVFALLRIPLLRLTRPALHRQLTAALAATLLLAMVAYYVLVLLGLHAWGRVVTWPLIRSYAPQLPGLADTLGVPLLGAATALAAAWLAMTGGWHWWLARFDWVAPLHRGCTTPRLAAATVAMAALLALLIHGYVVDPRVAEFEPLSLTFSPAAYRAGFEGHDIDRLAAQNLDRAEDAARAAYVPGAAGSRRNLVLIVVDALRTDHMGTYGYARQTTPYLDRLAREGGLRVVHGLHSSCADSACGHLSLAASKPPHQFSQRPFTLYEALRRNGYRVHLIIGGDHTNFYGLRRRVYGEVDSYFDGSVAASGYINDDQMVLDHLARFPAWDGTPSMFQFHLLSAHVLGTRHPAAQRFLPAENYVLRVRGIGAAQPSQAAVNYYDNGVLNTDQVLQSLLHMLEANGYLREALVVITADHGEALGEHGLYGHANSLYEPLLRVPLLWQARGFASTLPPRLPALLSQVDLAPTVMAELGLPQPASWAGQPWHGGGATQVLYLEENGKAGFIDAGAGATWKYWVDARSGEEFAFDLDNDPTESRNLVTAVSADRRREWRRRVLAHTTLPFFDD
jgi:glucan phosphoethanolaminetransferase (alkaline phosphatase superfamily)